MIEPLAACVRCQGFLPSAAACPNCGHAPARRSFTGVWAAAGAAVSALTLMACYGAPPCDYHGGHGDGGGDPGSSCYDPIEDHGDAGVDAGQEP